MADFIESILPSGRGIRVEKLKTKAYREAHRRAAERGAMTGIAFSTDVGLELMLSALRGVTTGPVDLKFKVDPATNVEGTDIDLDATLDAVHETAWAPCTYLSLTTAGPTSLDELLSDPGDYDKASIFVQKAIMSPGPLGVSIGTKSRTVGK